MQNLYTEFSKEPLYVAKFICSPTLLLKNWDASRLILELDHDWIKMELNKNSKVSPALPNAEISFGQDGLNLLYIAKSHLLTVRQSLCLLLLSVSAITLLPLSRCSWRYSGCKSSTTPITGVWGSSASSNQSLVSHPSGHQWEHAVHYRLCRSTR